MNKAERLFFQIAEEAGFTVTDPPSIHCDKPVRNKRGDGGKTVTHPDFLVIDESLGREQLIEVTNGNGNGDAKRAQRRVVNRAKINNYTVITGYHIQQLEQAQTPSDKRALLIDWFGWNDTDKTKLFDSE